MKGERFWEIDALRGVAIALMIAFHVMIDLDFIGAYDFGLSEEFWFFAPRLIAATFIFLVGLSLYISYSRAAKNRKSHLFRKYLLRGLKIFGLGMVITAVTCMYMPDLAIVFGVLHFIGVAVIIAYPFMRLGRWNDYLPLGAMLLLVGLMLQMVTVSFPWLIWLGIPPASFQTLDYFPLLTWFGVVLIGMYFGNLLYKGGKRVLKIRNNRSLPIRFLSFLGRHSLLIYFLHQPVILAVLCLLLGRLYF
jgi:uncharacterized membrane protein